MNDFDPSLLEPMPEAQTQAPETVVNGSSIDSLLHDTGLTVDVDASLIVSDFKVDWESGTISLVDNFDVWHAVSAQDAATIFGLQWVSQGAELSEVISDFSRLLSLDDEVNDEFNADYVYAQTHPESLIEYYEDEEGQIGADFIDQEGAPQRAVGMVFGNLLRAYTAASSGVYIKDDASEEQSAGEALPADTHYDQLDSTSQDEDPMPGTRRGLFARHVSDDQYFQNIVKQETVGLDDKAELDDSAPQNPLLDAEIGSSAAAAAVEYDSVDESMKSGETPDTVESIPQADDIIADEEAEALAAAALLHSFSAGPITIKKGKNDILSNLLLTDANSVFIHFDTDRPTATEVRTFFMRQQHQYSARLVTEVLVALSNGEAPTDAIQDSDIAERDAAIIASLSRHASRALNPMTLGSRRHTGLRGLASDVIRHEKKRYHKHKFEIGVFDLYESTGQDVSQQEISSNRKSRMVVAPLDAARYVRHRAVSTMHTARSYLETLQNKFGKRSQRPL